jgi:hypothetical protein
LYATIKVLQMQLQQVCYTLCVCGCVKDMFRCQWNKIVLSLLRRNDVVAPVRKMKWRRNTLNGIQSESCFIGVIFNLLIFKRVF